MIRLPVKIGVKKTILVAWVGAEPLFLYFGIDSAHAPSPRAYQSSSYPQNPTSILLSCCSLILDVNIQVWNRSFLTHLLKFWEMTQNAHLTNRRGFSLKLFCNDVWL